MTLVRQLFRIYAEVQKLCLFMFFLGHVVSLNKNLSVHDKIAMFVIILLKTSQFRGEIPGILVCLTSFIIFYVFILEIRKVQETALTCRVWR